MPTDTSLTPVSPPARDFRVTRVAAPLRQKVVESIRNAIATGRFVGGERLTEKELCELTGVSRTLVREALRQLESEGLVEVVPNRGPVVARLSLQQAEQIYRVRSELESLAAELFAVNASETDVRNIKVALKQLKATVSTSDAATRLAAKDDFYGLLIHGGGNEALGQVLSLLNSRITLLRATSMQHKGRWQKSVQELSALVDALCLHDAAAARNAAMLHVANAAAAALDELRKNASA